MYGYCELSRNETQNFTNPEYCLHICDQYSLSYRRRSYHRTNVEISSPKHSTHQSPKLPNSPKSPSPTSSQISHIKPNCFHVSMKCTATSVTQPTKLKLFSINRRTCNTLIILVYLSRAERGPGQGFTSQFRG